LVGDSTITSASPARRDRRLPSPLSVGLAAFATRGRLVVAGAATAAAVCGALAAGRLVLGLVLGVLLVAIRFRVSPPAHLGVNSGPVKKRARFPDSKDGFYK
jgi:hypothetical protein